MPQTDILVIGFKSVGLVVVFLIFLLHFIYVNSIQITNLFKIWLEFSKNILLYIISRNFKDAVTNSRKHLTTTFTKIIC